MNSWRMFLEKIIHDFEDKGYIFNRLAEMNIITIANKIDMSYDFYIKHNMHIIERKVVAMINKDKNLINKFNCDWRHPVNRKLESCRV